MSYPTSVQMNRAYNHKGSNPTAGQRSTAWESHEPISNSCSDTSYLQLLITNKSPKLIALLNSHKMEAPSLHKNLYRILSMRKYKHDTKTRISSLPVFAVCVCVWCVWLSTYKHHFYIIWFHGNFPPTTRSVPFLFLFFFFCNTMNGEGIVHLFIPPTNIYL